eukprot:CAMPEP_0114116908 /NCGR_PEP_ID=MMETSP0043_2-20121206/4748_1 /TAXON_ID=464988 /ORGANISM="Hemiselmis andersenii, Strain CCMP644" /LENGTH=41 /DNA_ID= /DNA_START= /DNA_END= /DNA_ORIENTATION=
MADPNQFLLEQCKELNNQGLHASAAALGCFLMGSHQLDPEV